jgi:hypothetical protein
MDMEDIIADALIAALSERIDAEVLKKAFTKPVKKVIYRKLTEGLFYNLLKEKKLNLISGFGTVLIKDIKEKEKKVFDKKTGSMVTKKVKGSKVVYRPGDFMKQFL